MPTQKELDEFDSKLRDFKNYVKENLEEFRRKLETKRRKTACITRLVRIFCCPCIAIWNLTRI